MSLPLKHKIISWVSQNLFDNLTYTVRSGLNKGLRRRGGLGWVPREHMTAEHAFWDSLDLRGKVVYDIGAFHGLLTIFFARAARKVIAWEPNSRNRSRLLENVRLNNFQNVIVRPYGLSSKASTATMSFDPLAPGTASIDQHMAQGADQETIEIRILDAEQDLEPPDFIKIDVEGFELEVLKGAPRTLENHPTLFLEMHGANLEDKRRRVQSIVEHLWEFGYRDILHIESQTRINRSNAAIASQGHLYVTYN